MRGGALAVAAAALALLAGCGETGTPERARTAGGDPRCGPRGGDVAVGPGATLHLPRGGGDGPWPLVVALHGAGGSGLQAGFLGFSALGDREGFAALYPTARRRGFWALNPTYRPDDVPAVRALLRDVLARPCLDRRRVFATGVSNGGGFAARLGCEVAGVRAVAPVAGGYRAIPRCRSDRPVGLLEVHGAADPVTPYAGRGPAGAGSVPRFVRAWARRLGCDARRVSAPRPGGRRERWAGCRAPVEHLRLARTGHGWPGLATGAPGDPTGTDTTAEVWAFFSRLR